MSARFPRIGNGSSRFFQALEKLALRISNAWKTVHRQDAKNAKAGNYVGASLAKPARVARATTGRASATPIWRAWNLRLLLLLLLVLAYTGCLSSSPAVNPHVVKCNEVWPWPIANPYLWTLIQFADGPLSGADPYAKDVINNGLAESVADIDGDGLPELFIRDDASARVHGITVFKAGPRGYRYLGHFGACWVVIPQDACRSVLVYESCGGHYGFIKKHQTDGYHFTCLSSEGLAVGDGAPDANNAKLKTLFPPDKILKWELVPAQKYSGKNSTIEVSK